MNRILVPVPTLLVALLLAGPFGAGATFPVDPGISPPVVTRLSPGSARVEWTTTTPATGGVLQYSKKHEFAVGIDPFTLRIRQETGEAALAHAIVVDDIDASAEWRFLVSYQPDPRFKYDSEIVHPFAAATVEVPLPATTGETEAR